MGESARVFPGLFAPTMDEALSRAASKAKSPWETPEKDSGFQNRYRIINELESSVSLLQSAQNGFVKIRDRLLEIKEFIETIDFNGDQPSMPESVINNFLADRLRKIQAAAEETAFRETRLLTGQIGVTGEVKGYKPYAGRLRFVRGSSFVKTSEEKGYPVAINQTASRAVLSGTERLTKEILDIEKTISVFEGERGAHYQLKRNENPESLIRNLQETILDHGLDITVLKTRDDHLACVHNQYGSHTRLCGVSHKTKIVSPSPGKPAGAREGEDIRGTIGEKFAVGRGAYLVGAKGEPETEGMVLYYDGRIDYPGQIVGYVQVRQNGIVVPGPEILNWGATKRRDKTEILSIPSLLPVDQSIGVANHSGFGSLADIKAGAKAARIDALKMVLWALEDLDYLIRFYKKKEDGFVERTINIMKSHLQPKAEPCEVLRNQQKASEMAEHLRKMLIETAT